MTSIRVPYTNEFVFDSERYLRPGVFQWLKEVAKPGQWSENRYGEGMLGEGVSFVFKDPRIAVMFKLRWFA